MQQQKQQNTVVASKNLLLPIFHFILTGGDDNDVVQSRKPETAPGLLPAANHHRGLGLPHHLVAVVLVAGSGKSWFGGVTIGRDSGVAGSMPTSI